MKSNYLKNTYIKNIYVLCNELFKIMYLILFHTTHDLRELFKVCKS